MSQQRGHAAMPARNPSARDSFHDLPPTVWERLEQVLERFEDAWRGGGRPALEDYLEGAGAQRRALLVELAHADLHYRLQAGEPARAEDYLGRYPELRDDPGVVRDLIVAEYRLRRPGEPGLAADDYLRRFPEHAAALSGRLGDTGPTPEAATEARPADGSPGSSAESGGATVGQPVSPGALPTGADEVAPRYELLGELGRGGMGVVYRARDPELYRDLAVKVLREEHRGRPHLVRRFLKEARINSRLQHPGVVPVHELGTAGDGRPYFAMKLVNGRTQDDLLKKRGDPTDDAPRFLAHFGQVCQALAYAHSEGVVHRDLKPANVMVGAFGEVQVMDWGLAKALGPAAKDEAALAPQSPAARAPGTIVSLNGETQPGQAMGTLAYMPPEQARGEVERVDRRADVFGLGAILCEVLTGLPPFGGKDVEEVLARARVCDHAKAMTRLDGCGADAELVRLCKGCLAAERSGRPCDAGAVARAVAAYQAGVQERLRRAELEKAAAEARAAGERKRRRLAVVLTAALVLVAGLAATAGSSTWLWQRAEDAAGREKGARGQAEQAKRETEQARDALDVANEKLEHLLSLRQISLANAALRDHAYGQADSLLQKCPPERRRWEWHYLRRLCHPELRTLIGHMGEVQSMAFSPDGRHLASGGVRPDGRGGEVYVWDVQTGRVVRTLLGHAGGVSSVAFSPDGRYVAAAGGDGNLGELKVWDVATGQEHGSLPRHSAEAHGLAFGPDSKRLATTDPVGIIRVWDTNTRKVVFSFGQPERALGVALSPDGKHLAGAGKDLKVVDARTGAELFTCRGHTGKCTAVAYSPDGQRLASASHDGSLKEWDARTGRELLTLRGHVGPVSGVVFSPDGQRLASGGWDRTIRVWDANTGRQVRSLSGHDDQVTCVVFSPDGRRVASASKDRTVKVWDAWPDQRPQTLQGATAFVMRAVFSPDRGVFSPDGRTLALAFASPGGLLKARIFDVGTGRQLRTLEGYANVGQQVFSQDGKMLAAAGANNTVKVWDVTTGKELHTLTGHTRLVVSVAFSPDGHWIASGAQGGEVRVWEAQSGREVLTLRAVSPYGVAHIAFSPDGKRLVSFGTSLNLGVLNVWDAANGRALLSIASHVGEIKRVTGLAFSPHGNCLAIAFLDKTVSLWDAQTGKEILALEGPTHRSPSMAFSPDGERLAVASADLMVRVWDVRTGLEIIALRGHTSGALAVAFSPDGKRLASADTTGKVLIWDGTPLDEKPPTPFLGQGPARRLAEKELLAGHTAIPTCVAYSSDGRQIVSGSYDCTVKLWDPGSREVIWTLEGHTQPVWGLAFSPGGRRLASSSGHPRQRSTPAEIMVWDTETGKPLLTLPSPGGGVYGLAVSPDGRLLASAGFDKIVRLWDLDTGKEVRVIPGHTKEVWGVAFSPDSRRLASSGFDRTVRVWDVATGKEVLKVLDHSLEVWAVTWSPDGKFLASASDDRTVKVWDAATGKELRTLRGHTISPYSVCFSRDGTRLLSASGHRWQPGQPGEVIAWDLATGKELARLSSGTYGFFAAAFAPDGRHFACAAMDRTVKLCDLQKLRQAPNPGGTE
jgi:WD40 repeat protein/serine/threonine protein kinase